MFEFDDVWYAINGTKTMNLQSCTVEKTAVWSQTVIVTVSMLKTSNPSPPPPEFQNGFMMENKYRIKWPHSGVLKLSWSPEIQCLFERKVENYRMLIFSKQLLLTFFPSFHSSHNSIYEYHEAWFNVMCFNSFAANHQKNLSCRQDE